MEIEFDNQKLCKTFSCEKNIRREWGDQMAKKLKQRLADLEACATLENMRYLPGHCHELAGNRKGQLALNLVHPKRLIIEPARVPIPKNDAGGLDWSKVTAIRVLEVVDYH